MHRSTTIAAFSLAVSVSALTVSTASAQNPGFELGNLFLGFQTTGAGSDKYVIANIGDSATLFRDTTTNQINLININAALTAQFGAGWADRTDLFIGAGASWSNDEFGAAERNGDPYNTLYVGNPRQFLGVQGQAGSSGFFLTGAQIQDASNGLFAAGDVFEAQGSSGISTILSTGAFAQTFVDYNDQNSVAAGGVQGNAYNGVFSGGVQDAFEAGTFGTLGGINAEAALDLYRINSIAGTSTYEGTIVLDNLGNVSFIVSAIPEPSSCLFIAAGAGALGFVRRRRAIGA